MANSSGVTREELMAMREVAAKAWKSSHDGSLSAYLDREYPLPAPEPQRARGSSGEMYTLAGAEADPDKLRVHRQGSGTFMTFPVEDRATVANLLVPFEDVVRATLDRLGVDSVNRNSGGGSWEQTDSVGTTLSRIPRHLPAILKRLESR